MPYYKSVIPFLQRARHLILILIYTALKYTTKVDDNRILLLSDSRSKLSGNLKFIYDEVVKYNYEVRYLLKPSLKSYRPIKDKMLLPYLIATSKYIIIDDYYPLIYPLKLRKEVKLIQAWHAMGAFKTFGFARLGKSGGPNPGSITHSNYTNAIVSSEFVRKDYAKAFKMAVNNILATGIPRTDVFFDNKYIREKKDKIYKEYPILKNKKVVLFAPTFRGNGQKTAYYDFSYIDFEKLMHSLGEEYVFIIKMHPFINKKPLLPKNSKNFYLDFSDKREINDILFVTDILITDYSSVIFEYSFLQKPIIFYAPDLKEYIENRDFFYPFNMYTYGPVVYNQDDLISCIKTAEVDIKKLNKFRKYFCSACDGNSTKKFVKEIILENK